MRKITLGFLLLFSCFLQAQLQVNTPASAKYEDVVKNYLIGNGITPFWIDFNYSFLKPSMAYDQCGFWSIGSNPTAFGFTPGQKGVLLTTGKGEVALGPNNAVGKSLLTSTPVQGDSDLALISGGTIKNIAMLEFDFVATGNKLSFDYVFGSEEYPEFANSDFTDVFGIFLSGPGISGGEGFANDAENIAMLPNTTTGNYGVSINNVNDHTNSNYYVSNPPNASDIQYDGFTTVLNATHELIIGETYHIKFALANVSDNTYDSGLFLRNLSVQKQLKTTSFSSNDLLLYPNPAKNQVQISLQNSAENLDSVVIYNVLGNCVKRAKNVSSNLSSIDVSDLAKGVYVMEIATQSQLKMTKKLIIE